MFDRENIEKTLVELAKLAPNAPIAALYREVVRLRNQLSSTAEMITLIQPDSEALNTIYKYLYGHASSSECEEESQRLYGHVAKLLVTIPLPRDDAYCYLRAVCHLGACVSLNEKGVNHMFDVAACCMGALVRCELKMREDVSFADEAGVDILRRLLEMPNELKLMCTYGIAAELVDPVRSRISTLAI